MRSIGDLWICQELRACLLSLSVGIENWVFSRAIGPETFTFLHKQSLSLDVIGDINVFATRRVTPIISRVP